MAKLLDANAIIRLLLNDIPEQEDSGIFAFYVPLFDTHIQVY